jgi:hypothetical protein
MQNMLDTIVHYANAEDEATGDAFEIFHFRKVGNRRGQIRVPRQDLQKPEALYALLVGKNAALPLCREKSTSGDESPRSGRIHPVGAPRRPTLVAIDQPTIIPKCPERLKRGCWKSLRRWPSLRPRIGPLYNPVRRNIFRIEDWSAVVEARP